MDTTSMALQQGLGRIAFGVTMILAPEKVIGPWIGPDADKPTVKVISRALGARDLCLGAGAAAAARAGYGLRPWLVAGVFADVVDLVATVKAADRIPASGVAIVGALATTSTLVGAYLLAHDDSS